MPRKEFIHLMEDNIITLDRLAGKMRIEPTHLSGYPRQLLRILMRVHMGGRGRLKDIARREMVSAPNLCAAFRKLERDGLLVREIDENDRRNVWYAVTPKGEKVAVTAMENFQSHIEQLFSNLPAAEEVKLTSALRTLKEVLQKMELDNA